MIRSSATDGVSARPTTNITNTFGCDVDFCHPCNKTFTILPDWLAPSAPFSLQCRQQACESIAAGASEEQAAPHCKDPSRSPDPSTLRRWAHRRLLSVCCWLNAGAIAAYFFRPPTIVAWDLGALCRILPIEARSP
jgi:hypothetical protein